MQLRWIYLCIYWGDGLKGFQLNRFTARNEFACVIERIFTDSLPVVQCVILLLPGGHY